MHHVDRRSRGSAAGIAIGNGLDDPEARVRIPVGSRIFTSVSALGPTQPLSRGGGGYSVGNVMLITHLQLVPRSRKHGYVHPSSWRSTGTDRHSCQILASFTSEIALDIMLEFSERSGFDSRRYQIF
jgi:hypothetical protein